MRKTFIEEERKQSCVFMRERPVDDLAEERKGIRDDILNNVYQTKIVDRAC